MEFLYENNNNNKQKSSQDTSVFTSIRITSDPHFKTNGKQIFVELFLFVCLNNRNSINYWISLNVDL